MHPRYRYKRLEVIKPTDDEWYGNDFIRNRFGKEVRVVQVSYIRLPDGTHRVCVWGNDDFGLEFDYKKHRDALRAYKRILSMEKVNKQPLKDMSFYPA